MSGEKHIKLAIIAALCGHPEQDKYKNRAFSGENLQKMMDAMSGHGSELKKADFFMADDDGKFIIDTPGFWTHLGQINALLQKNGEAFYFEDFMKPLNGRPNGRTLLDSATEHNGVAPLFTVDIWRGRYEEMESLWYHVPAPIRKTLFKRDSQIDPDLKRALLAAEGRALPEDRLTEAGLTATDILKISMPRSNLDEVNRRLRQNGDFLRKDYLLLTDTDGDTVFYQKNIWPLYNEIVSGMMAHGERFEVADLIRHVGTRPNILIRAVENGGLSNLFTPSHWAGRLDDMLTLWNHVLPAWKVGSMTSKDFDIAYATAEDLTYGDQIALDVIKSSADLLAPVSGTSILPLSLKSVWEQIENVQETIAVAGGQKLTTGDLRHSSGALGYSCLMNAVKLGFFGAVLDVVRQSGEALSVDDFLKKDKHDNSMLSILASQRELSRVFSPELWVGRVADMKKLWSHIAIADQGQVNIQQVEVAVKQATLKQQNKPRLQPPGGPKR